MLLFIAGALVGFFVRGAIQQINFKEIGQKLAGIAYMQKVKKQMRKERKAADREIKKIKDGKED